MRYKESLHHPLFLNILRQMIANIKKIYIIQVDLCGPNVATRLSSGILHPIGLLLFDIFFLSTLSGAVYLYYVIPIIH